MSLAPASRRGAFLKARLPVNGIQCAARSFGTLTAGLGGLLSSIGILMHCAGASSAAHAISFGGAQKPTDGCRLPFGKGGRVQRPERAWADALPRCGSAGTTPRMAENPKKPQKLRARLPRGLADRGPAE